MNFHISNLSPLRPQFSSSSLGTRRSSRSSDQNPGGVHRRNPLSGPIKIEVEPAAPSREDGDEPEAGSSDEFQSDISADDVTQDSRDVLVQRLTDLAERLSGANVRTASVEALHRQVDEMERVLRGANRDRSTSRHSASPRVSLLPGSSSSRPAAFQLSTGGGSGAGGESPRGRDALGIMAPMSPSWLMSHFQRRPSMHEEQDLQESRNYKSAILKDETALPRMHWKSDSQIHRPSRSAIERLESVDAATSTGPAGISSEVAETVVYEAEKLCAEMATVIESLQTRREESDHIHAVLMQREAVANQRLHEQAAAVGDLEEVVADYEAELRHLRLELRAIEAQSLGYVPKGADPALDQSIRNWKDDWRALREKFATRRGSSFLSGDDSSTFSTLASPMSR